MAYHASTTVVLETSYEEPLPLPSSPQSTLRQRQRRRHSSYNPRQWSPIETEDLQVLLDRFLAELNRRLDFLETYGHLSLSLSLSPPLSLSYETLTSVRDACAEISSNALDTSRRRARVLVDVLEERYQEAVARKETLEQKVCEGVRVMEGMLGEFERRAYAGMAVGREELRDLVGEGRRRVDEGLEKARGVVDEGIERAREVVDEGLERARRAREGLKGKIEMAIMRARETGLLQYHEMPDPWRVNPHILKGYRFNECKTDCIRSMLSVSNELVNIWSHLIGLIIVLSIAFYFYPLSPNFSSSTTSDIFIAAVFFFAACKCLVCSTVWHTMNSIAEQTLMERFACVDYTGISFLVAASIMTTEYTAFYCEPFWRWAWMLTTAIFGIAGSILPWHPTFNRADMSWARVAFYVTLAATGFFPVVQLAYSRGADWAIYFYLPITKSVMVYLVGAILYAGKVPERWFPGAFDYVGGSHNIWHFAVLGGILFHYHAMHHFFEMAFLRAGTEACSVY
ncbi:MAG: hypothetical protein M1820_009946 [Bogoriella megaspora]|nr:MAG: hypothetical protein M1820_009946 [Bogoriella megaspora]